jgi:hypothetical protein
LSRGTFIEIGERKRQKAVNALQSGFRCQAAQDEPDVQSAGMADTYGPGGDVIDDGSDVLAPRADCGDPGLMPLVMEWWDTEMLPYKIRKQVQAQESDALLKDSRQQLKQLGTKTIEEKVEAKDNEHSTDFTSSCFDQAALSYSKTAGLVQHIIPIGAPQRREKFRRPHFS